MASSTTSQPPKTNLGKVLVIGGCGFLGHNLISLLLSSYHTSTLSVLDLRTTRNRHPDSSGVAYYTGDITSLESILPTFQTVKPDVVIHTASPVAVGGNVDRELYWRVNVEGTKRVIEACQQSGVKALVYTSSASVCSDGDQLSLVNADERWPVVEEGRQREYYSWTKAQGEQAILSANRSPASPTLLTCAIRPAAIFGPGDVQMIPAMISVYRNKQTGFQLGDNTNLYDFTYVLNVAHGHALAAVALLQTSSLKIAPLDTERVDGEAFIVTNGSPIPFWDFARAVWRACGSDKGTEHVWVISRDVGLLLSTVLEWGMWAVGRKSKLTRREVKYSSMTRYFDISKARKRLGYEPLVELEEGIRRSVEWFLERDGVQEGSAVEKKVL